MPWKRAALDVSAFIKLALIRRLVVGLALLLIAASSAAKCPMVLYEVRGKLDPGKTDKPLDGFEVIGFFDDYHHAIGNHENKYSRAITNSKGEFSLRGVFDSYQDYSWWGHECGGVPGRLEIIIRGDQGVERLEFRRGEFAIVREQGRPVITLPTIHLDH